MSTPLAHCHAICALAAEAGTLGRRGIAVSVCGPGQEAAHAAAKRCLRQAPALILSWGVAGALRPDLSSGDLVVPALITGADGRSWATGRGWGSLLSLPTPVLQATDKERLRQTTGCDAVDTETAAIARACAARGVAFAAVRTIVDPSRRDVPAWLAGLPDASGRVTVGRLMRVPRQRRALGDLWQALRQYRAALDGLRRAAVELERHLESPHGHTPVSSS